MYPKELRCPTLTNAPDYHSLFRSSPHLLTKWSMNLHYAIYNCWCLFPVKVSHMRCSWFPISTIHNIADSSVWLNSLQWDTALHKTLHCCSYLKLKSFHQIVAFLTVKGTEEYLFSDIGLLLVCLSAVANIKYSYSVAGGWGLEKKNSWIFHETYKWVNETTHFYRNWLEESKRKIW